jgi:hypothetical protein
VSDHLVEGEDVPKPRDVSASDAGRVRLNSPVRNVDTFWERFTIGASYVDDVQVADPSEVDVPVAFSLNFAAGPVWMVAGIPQVPQMRDLFIPGDEIIFGFTIDRMRQRGFLDSEFLAASRR